MDLLHKFKQNGYFSAALYHMLAKNKLESLTEDVQIIPSEYVKEMKMSTQQRLRNLNKVYVENIIRLDVTKPKKEMLLFTPRVLVFQNFKPNDKIVAKFTVTNISKTPTFLNMVFKESSYFSIKPCGSQLLSRLAPGISYTFAVTFLPIQYEDYTHRVTFCTDTDQYVVALIAMGPRPVFDFPDQIVVPETPLKIENVVHVSVHNIGSVAAGFTLSTKCPFTVQPKSAYLNPGQMVSVRVGMKSMNLGELNGFLNALFETGEHFKIILKGTTHIVKVELEKEVVRFDDTFNTMVRQCTFKIRNKSDHLLTYLCMKNDCVYFDFQEKMHLASMFYELKDSESAKNEKLVQFDVLSSEEHDRVYTRIFFDEIQSLVADETLQFQNMHFDISPINGKLWPNKTTEITVIFSPKEIGDFTATVYLDIDGVYDRIPLIVKGTSLPPAIVLNLETLDMSCVYINKQYQYEIVAINKGHINGVIVYKDVPTLFGSKITCTPVIHCLRPGEKQIFVLAFSNSNQGTFFEEINFIIRDTEVVLKLFIKGEVTYPSLAFSVPCLDFGKVSLGVPKTLSVDVINESVVEVSGSIKISSDGPEIGGITLKDYAVSDSPKPQIPPWPREFNIEPSKIELKSESKITLKVTLIPNLIRANKTSLELELEKSDSPPIILPVTYNAMIPKISPVPDIKLRACFLDFPYEQEIKIVSNEFKGYFTLDDSEEEQSTLKIEVGKKEGFIEPNSTMILPVTIKSSYLGEQEYTFRIKLFGLPEPLEICHITGVGVRPIVTSVPTALYWGQVKLLTKTQKTLTLCNDSPVVVYYKAFLLNKDGRWQIHPTEGQIQPESETEIILTLYLIDASSYTNKAVIQLEKVKDILVPLSATGIGTSIVVDGPGDDIELGRHFTKIPLNCKVVMENCGTKLHSLEWSEHYKAPKNKQQINAAFFSLDPKTFKMASGEKTELTIIGLSYKVATVKEMWYLIGSVEGINKKELLYECQIVAEFVDPKIEISAPVVEFQYDCGPYSEYYKLTDIVTIKNVSKLPLDFDISVKPPFAIIQKHSSYKISPEDENLCCCICYNESDLNITNMISEIGEQQSRHYIDYLTLKPIEPLRKCPLHFFQDIRKIKMAFNITHTVEERLEDQEVIKLQILFDTTKHYSLKSRVYCDIMRIKFKGHKNKDHIKLIGKINLPNMFVISPRVDFQCILNGRIESKTIKVQNVTPLLVCYRFQWKTCLISTSEPEHKHQKEDKKGSEARSISSIPTENIPEVECSENVINTDIASIQRCPTAVDSADGYENVMKHKLFKTIHPMLDIDYGDDFDWMRKFARITKPTKININDVLQVVPHRGLLKPNDIQDIHVMFRPKLNMSVRAILECEILGGPPETIIVTGQSSDLIYSVNTQSVNFKIRSFHESASENIIISNIAQLPFEYKTYLNEPTFKNELEGTILDLVPPEKTLQHTENHELKIIMRPGVVGYFKRNFLLEIGHLPYITIEVFGWGVVPQVYLSLPRPDIATLHPMLGYEAIPALTHQYLDAVHEFFLTKNTAHLNSPSYDYCYDDPDFQNDWYICSSWDDYPSIMDIELAIERMLLIKHINDRPEILTPYLTTNKMDPIPGFHTTPYVIDYGVIITGSTVQCVADIVNYGPITTKVHFSKHTCVPPWLIIKLCGKLMPGETGKLEVTFSPTSVYFPHTEERVEISFFLEVPYGITIPLQIKALCAVPYLTSNVDKIDFGSVRCGDKIISSILLKNVGKPTCIWYVTLKLKAPGDHPMTVLNSSGKYEPEEGGRLSVAFKPTMEMKYEGLLIFRFHMNPTRMLIPVIGHGIVPHVHVIGPKVTFPPTLPWSRTTEIYFGLTNPCPFPIELIIAHSDEKWKEEEVLYQFLYKYYNKPEEMLVPAINPGVGMPPEITGFYQTFKDEVKRHMEQETAMSSKMSSSRGTSTGKGKKTAKTAQKSTNKDVSPQRKCKSEAEITYDVIKSMKEKGLDPLKDCDYATKTTDSETELVKGLIVFFHGSPCSEIECQEIAYSLGKELDLTTISFDNCIVEALCLCECEAKDTILNGINESFEIARKSALENDFMDEYSEESYECDDKFSEISKKIQFISTAKNVPTSRAKVADKKKKKSPNSSTSGSHTALGGMGTSSMFQMDLIILLLTEYFNLPKFRRGVIIDSLSSFILKNPPLVLTTVIRCKQMIKNIHLVLCLMEFTKWAQAYEETQKEYEISDETTAKVYDEKEIEEIIKSFEDMDEEEYENSPPELKAIYITQGLEQRRKQHLQKHETIEVTKKEKHDKASGKSDPNKSTSSIEYTEKKKSKKEETKGKQTPEYLAMNLKFNEYYKNIHDQLINIANNWVIEECDVGMPLIGFSGQPLGTNQKKTKKAKSEVQLLQISETNFDDRGFPLTLITCPCLRYKKGLLNMFATTPFIKDALRERGCPDILKYPVDRKEYTVLLPKTLPTLNFEEPLKWRCLDEIPIMKCECSQLTDLCLLDDSTQDYVLDILSKWHCTCDVQVNSSQTSTTEIPSLSIAKVSEESESETFYPKPLPLTKVKSLPTACNRLILKPGDLVRCKYTFDPQQEGIFSIKRYVEASGWPASRVDIHVSGICDVPRLDSRPKKMFENFIRRTVDDQVYKSTYLDDQKMFEFGPIFVGNLRIYEEDYCIYLKNSSLITADIVIEFLEETTVFQLNKTSITLEPGSRDKLTISAAPVEVGVYRSVLLFCVKDNPEVVTVTIGCCGVVPSVEILPTSKSIEYGKLLLYRRGDDRFIIRNDSILPIMWKIRNVEEFVEDFIISDTTGIIPRHDNQVVPVTYTACKVGVIANRMLIIDIFDALGRGSPMFVDNLFLSAECYDVMVECAYESASENYLNYGNVKVNTTVVREMYLLNKGRYTLYYKLKKVKNFPEPALLKSFEVQEETGVIPLSPKVAIIEFTCTPETSINLVNVPAFTCSLLDGNKDQVVVAKFPVCITIASFYNTFTLFPLGELNFNIIPVGSGEAREVILNNTSKCPFTYEIELPEQYRLDLIAPPPKITNNKIKVPPIKCGNFLIMNEDNLLPPGTSRVISIQFLASAATRFEETIKFIISDTCPAEAQGVPLKLVGTGALPILDFWNVETTFREHLIVKSLSEYKVHESSPHCVFVENSVSMHFFCVNVNTVHVGGIDLYNNGLVPCALTMKLHYQVNSNESIFSLDTYNTYVQPLLHKKLGVIFSPKALEEYRAVLEINLKLLNSRTRSFKVCLIGEGVIPRIQFLSPKPKQHGVIVLRFPVTCLGSISTMNIKFKNISTVNSIVLLDIIQSENDERPIFWLTTLESCEHIIVLGRNDRENTNMNVEIKPEEMATIVVHYNPIRKGKNTCEISLAIHENPYEFFTVLCEGEAFMEDVILVGLEMLPMDIDVNMYKTCEVVADGNISSPSTADSSRKFKTTQSVEKRKSLDRKSKKGSQIVSLRLGTSPSQSSVLKYILNYGGCELCTIQKRTVNMINNSDKVYKFTWEEVDYIVTKPSTGYISPGEEKDIEIIFFAGQPVVINKEILECHLSSISNDFLTMEFKNSTWDSRQMITKFEHNKDVSLNERSEVKVDANNIELADNSCGSITILVIYSAVTEYIKYSCSLHDQVNLRDTFIYQVRTFKFNVVNVGNVPMKITWSFRIDDEYPGRISKYHTKITEEKDYREDSLRDDSADVMRTDQLPPELVEKESSQLTLFSGSPDRDSVDTWFEIDLPFRIEPERACLSPKETCTFKVTFTPLEAFYFQVRLRSSIDNLDPYDQNISCQIKVKSFIPYVHLDIEESDYLYSGRRKPGGITMPEHTYVLEYNVLGWGCYKKSFNVINPTSEGYEFIFEMVLQLDDKPDLIPVHCNMLKGWVASGNSQDVTFSFSPSTPGVSESQWKFVIPVHNLVLNLLVVGIVREPVVLFNPTILIIRNSLVGFTSTNIVYLNNSENESLNFEFKGNSLCNESGKTPVIVEPDHGVMKPRSETPIKIIYTPIQDGPLSFKIFCSVMFMTQTLTLCVNALSYSIKPKVTYYIIGNEHVLNSDVNTNIHLDQTASTYERTIPFKIKNDGSATFSFDWFYYTLQVQKYLQMYVEPKSGHVSPGSETECILYFTLKQVPVRAFPVTLTISDGPEYTIFLYADISKPRYHFSSMEYDFRQCFINAPDDTYKKCIAFINDDNVSTTLHLNFQNTPDLYVDTGDNTKIGPGNKHKIIIYFRPKQAKEYEFKLQFWVNSLCEEILTIYGQGIHPLFDIYEGCQKSFDLGPVRVGEKIVRSIEVMNYSKIPVDAKFIFRDMYPTIQDNTSSDATTVCLGATESKAAPDNELSRGKMLQVYKNDKVRDQIAMDIENALRSLKVVPNRCSIMPYEKTPLKIQFKPIGMISNLNVQLNMKVLSFERPLVRLSGSATGMNLCLNQSSLQFGRVRKKGVKVLKVLLQNKGDFGANFWWQPLRSEEFKIAPMKGNISARSNVTFTITFRPINHNPFIKVWASCNIENYKGLELALYATCVDVGNIQSQTLYLECPVRDVVTEYITVTNPSDDLWLVLSEVSEDSFETPKEFNIEPNSSYSIPVHFKPKTYGKHEGQVLYSPLGEMALFVSLVGNAVVPNPNGEIEIKLSAKESHTEELLVHNITEKPETYIVQTQIIKTVPDKFEGHYEINHPETVKVWGEASATCRWSYVCYGECEMIIRVSFIDSVTKEYQFYNITATIVPSEIVDTLVVSARARETVQNELLLKNPLSTDASYQIQCTSLSCPFVVQIGKFSELKVKFDYSPLIVGETEDFLVVHNNLAGSFIYKVILKCLPAKKKKIDTSTPFGCSVPLRLRVSNSTTSKTDFVTTTSHPSIQTEKDYTLGPFEKGKFLVWFEPTVLGVQNCLVSFYSPVAGEFEFDITGTATIPNPQGPYNVKVGGSTTITFKNVYEDTRTFRVYVDKDDFYLKMPTEPIKSKKELKVTVFLYDNNSDVMPTGSLHIVNVVPGPKVTWTYFLQGVP